MLFTGAVLLVIHYGTQIHFGFRAQGDDVGAVVNILFYTPVAYLMSCSIISIACGSSYMMRYMKIAVISMTVTMCMFIGGLITYNSLHMEHALYCMGGVFFLTMLFFIFSPAKKIREMRRKVENETASDLQNYNLYMHVGTRIILVLSVLIPFVIFSKYFLGVFGPVWLIALFFYVLCFVAMGFNMSFMEIVEDEASTNDEDNDNDVSVRLDDAIMQEIEQKVKVWLETKAFCNPNLNIKMMSQQIGIDKKIFSQYLHQKDGVTFRIWLSDLRIEQVKKMLLDDEHNYTNEAIAAECGFSSRSWMQQRFKAVTGMTPSEWKEKTE